MKPVKLEKLLHWRIQRDLAQRRYQDCVEGKSKPFPYGHGGWLVKERLLEDVEHCNNVVRQVQESFTLRDLQEAALWYINDRGKTDVAVETVMARLQEELGLHLMNRDKSSGADKQPKIKKRDNIAKELGVSLSTYQRWRREDPKLKEIITQEFDVRAGRPVPTAYSSDLLHYKRSKKK